MEFSGFKVWEGARKRAPSMKIATLSKGIKLPGMGSDLSILDGRGGAAGDVEYEEDTEAAELERMGNLEKTDKQKLADKMAKMLRSSQLSRGIMTKTEGMVLDPSTPRFPGLPGPPAPAAATSSNIF